MKSGYSEHSELVDALESRDPQRAEDVMRKHIRRALAYMVGE
jgi:DNA-binding GntR family transcriptional regulator